MTNRQKRECFKAYNELATKQSEKNWKTFEEKMRPVISKAMNFHFLKCNREDTPQEFYKNIIAGGFPRNTNFKNFNALNAFVAVSIQRMRFRKHEKSERQKRKGKKVKIDECYDLRAEREPTELLIDLYLFEKNLRNGKNLKSARIESQLVKNFKGEISREEICEEFKISKKRMQNTQSTVRKKLIERLTV